MNADRSALLAAAAACAFVGLLAAESWLVPAETQRAERGAAGTSLLDAAPRVAADREPERRITDDNGEWKCCNELSTSPAPRPASSLRARCCSRSRG